MMDGFEMRRYGHSSKPAREPATVPSYDRDTKALAAHGKRQQLNVCAVCHLESFLTGPQRRFGFISAIAFSSIILSSWEAIAA